jgi:hypothetical protein
MPGGGGQLLALRKTAQSDDLAATERTREHRLSSRLACMTGWPQHLIDMPTDFYRVSRASSEEAKATALSAS